MYIATEKKCVPGGDERSCLLPLLEESVGVSGRFSLRYLLYIADGMGRALYGTACERVYCLRIILTYPSGLSEQCDLHDIARKEQEAKEVFLAFVRGVVTPCAAEEIWQELWAAGSGESERA